ncbi:LytR/AlgR family response regulator transcription factor [Polaribacter sp. Hel1_85]|uniref:LytR/AlgR family response regulator transcription factor n=1 Tax=Polaribacter sp. Hel1_85 TaxID=1250005 RepID=UPI00052E46FB|nr:LytTR family DNA-binding domain-containing protein [Polaribacter sp. Hel1_85]KGL62420.1 transcriptional regulator, LytTr family [Polaribacter sp. Hel1_85]
MKKIISWLSIPYYFNPSISFKFKFSVSIGLFVFLFLYIFKPFYLMSLEGIILQYTFGIGLVTFIGVFFFLYVPALIFKNYFNEDNWTIGRNIFLIIIGILFTGIVIWSLGNIYKSQYNIKNISLIRFLFYTYLVGTLPVVFFIFINEKNVREKREKRANAINTYNKEKREVYLKKLPSKIKFFSENKKENISFSIDDLVYITSQGNYASFFIKKETDIKEKILRVTLTKIEEKLKEYPNVFRCHKSYIINSNFINDISGNARGYLLKSNFISTDIPVSRSFSKQSLQKLIK